jgi:hypothetical protein
LPGQKKPPESETSRRRLESQLFQTGSADNPVIVFRDALTAKELFALRTARHRLAYRVIEAALLGERTHGKRYAPKRGGALGSSSTITEEAEAASEGGSLHSRI